MKTEIVKVNGCQITVSEATMRHGIERSLLIADGQEAIKKDPKMPRGDQMLRLYLYPDLVAATDKFVTPEGDEGRPTFELFAVLPDMMYAAWSTAVYKLNPHWEVKDPEKAKKDAAKKAS